MGRVESFWVESTYEASALHFNLIPTRLKRVKILQPVSRVGRIDPLLTHLFIMVWIFVPKYLLSPHHCETGITCSDVVQSHSTPR